VAKHRRIAIDTINDLQTLHERGHLQSETDIHSGPALGALEPMPHRNDRATTGKNRRGCENLESAIQLFDWSPDQAIDSDAWMFHVLRWQTEKMIGTSMLPASRP
jgi:hypothetical protein